MTQAAHVSGYPGLKQHTIWQDGHMPDPCTIVLFGATGDLAQRKILPTLAHLIHDHPIPEQFCIVAFARRPLDDDKWRAMVLESLDKYMPDDDKLDEKAKQSFAQNLFYCRSDFDDLQGYERLKELLGKLDEEKGTAGNRLFYLATPPDTDMEIVQYLGQSGLAQPEKNDNHGSNHQSWARIIFEKPFGHDLKSAQELNAAVGKVFQENQIYRIDHYMGKETVQNIMALRFSNGIFEPLWNQKYIDHVQVLVAESLGIEGRAEYYESAGTIRDIVQNHIMQILCLVAMEPPAAFDADAVRDEKVKVLRAISPLSPKQVATQTVRGQYVNGVINGQKVEGYKEEEGVSAQSMTDTYVALKLFIENWRWADVPIYVRTGKRLPKRSTEVTIQFKRVPHQLYNPSETKGLVPNRLTLRIQPDEGISLKIGAKVPGAAQHLESVDMSFNYNTAFGIQSPEAYERLIADCILGDSTLFIRRDEIEGSWKIIDCITQAWQDLPADSLHPYAAGTWGPDAASELIENDGRHWDNP
ncbi:MAG TPA: glucose-6-phosphate dehydrogenase [Dictyobacter sp.]|nr:glucose-6-phosphate dehydrogenase [Dictyobacter sp.]